MNRVRFTLLFDSLSTLAWLVALIITAIYMVRLAMHPTQADWMFTF
ncbi:MULTISPECIES: hypothetical protein [Spirosoma]|uniref:Uncharacterized protein n=1 Tax=Spirosoma liriopis TaxID=2937440 RepID=A0ABT0HNS0_9BACT|nr:MULTISPECIES: hypothetical protein [Spirosoma]MCK8493828.1 hypothetical protein [Spirosoma liriopis]UHG93480.1 hypothetical protein LQ777_11370 [Spirosoma oryzicola]